MLLDASSTSQTPEGVILIYICWCHLFPPMPDWFITAQKGDGGISEIVGVRAVCVSPFSQYIIDAVFLLLEHLSCIMHIKFMESIIVYQPWEVWEHFGLYLNLLHVEYIGGTSATSFCYCKKKILNFLLEIFQCLTGISVQCDSLYSFFHDRGYTEWDRTSCRMLSPLGLYCMCYV